MRAIALVGLSVLLVGQAAAQKPKLVGSRGGVEVWAIPEPSPGFGLIANTIELRTTDPSATIVTFEKYKLSGQVHHAWLGGPFGAPTTHLDTVGPGTTYLEEWAAFDSYFMFSGDMIGGRRITSFPPVETNDGSTTELIGSQLGTINEWTAKTGFGDIGYNRESDAFYIRAQFQGNSVPFAKVVGCDVQLTLGVLGNGIINSTEPNGALFGHNGNDAITIQSTNGAPCAIPEPQSLVLTAFVLLLGFVGRRHVAYASGASSL